MRTISREELRRRLMSEMPRASEREGGYVLVDVRKSERFFDEHIPGSINIPFGREHEYAARFDKNKEIIVYCDSEDSTLSSEIQNELVSQGFTHVFEYEGGMLHWKVGGYHTDRGEDAFAMGPQ